MKRFCSLAVLLSLSVIGCDDKRKAGGWYEGPGYNGQGKYEGPAQLVPNKGTYLTNDRELDDYRDAVRNHSHNTDELRHFKEQMAELDRN